MKTRKRIVLAALIIALIAAGSWGMSRIVKLRPAGSDTLSAEAPGEGVGRNPAVVRYLGAREAEEIGTAFQIDTYIEGEGPAPEWYRPDEPMAAEWRESYRQVAGKLEDAEPHPPVGIDAGGIDWNLCSELEGWDGHRMEVWEMDLYSRIVYLEFWGTSPECCEAGADSILRLWESGYYGPWISDTLTARAEDGSLVYSPYAYVWDWEYDPEGLADMRALCEDRFYNGPEWHVRDRQRVLLDRMGVGVMADHATVLKGLERCAGIDCAGCPYQRISPCQNKLAADALALLREQEPRIVTTADFENNPNLDDGGHLNVWEECKDGTRYRWNTISVNDVRAFTDIHRYWTSRPTPEQMRDTPWEGEGIK